MQRSKFLMSSVLGISALAAAPKKSWANTNPPSKGYVIRASENRFKETTKIGGLNPVDIKVSTKDTNGALSISEYKGFTKGGPPLHIHLLQDEVFIILEGEHLFQLGEERFHLTAGDTIFIPRNTPHAPCQLSDTGRYLFFYTPSGTMEDFFRELGNLKVEGQPSPEMMARLFEAHDMKIVGPPLPF